MDNKIFGKRQYLDFSAFDLYNYRSNVYECEIKVNRTLFNHDIIVIPSEFFTNSAIGFNTYDSSLEPGEVKGIVEFCDKRYADYIGEYEVSVILAKSSYYESNDDTVPKYKVKEKYRDEVFTDSTEIDLDKFERVNGGRRNIIRCFGDLGEIRACLHDVFSVSKFYSRIYEANNNSEPVYAGESMKCELQFIVENGVRHWHLKIKECCTLKEYEKLSIQDYKDIPVVVLRDLERIFSAQHINMVKESNAQKEYIKWYEPTGWIDISQKDTNALGVNKAVYMWQGISTKAGNLCVYIGFVNEELLTDRIDTDIANNKNIEIKHFRYSELIQAGELDARTVLETVTEVSYTDMYQLNSAYPIIYNDTFSEGIRWTLLSKGQGIIQHATTLTSVKLPDTIENRLKNNQDFIIKVKQLMSAAHLCIENKNNTNKIQLYSTGWQVSNSKFVTEQEKEELEKSKGVFFAKYLWRGTETSDNNKLVIYVGIVGVNKKGSKNENSVYNRIFDQEDVDTYADKNIERFSYISIVCDKALRPELRSEIIKTVEMQCINNVSSLFPFYEGSHPVERCITPLFKGTVDNGVRKTVVMLNDDKRHHNKYVKLEEKNK